MSITQINLSRLRRYIIITTIVVIVFGTGYKLGQQNSIQVSLQNHQPQVQLQLPSPSEYSQTVDFSLFSEVKRRLEKDYLFKDKLDQTAMLYGAINGLVNSLDDPYTTFLNPDDNQRSKEDLGGSFFGVGIQLGYKDDLITVIAPLAGMPAELAGVKAGDQIIKIDGQDATQITLPEAVNLIRGQEGTQVTLTLVSPEDQQPRDVTIIRDEIIVPSLKLTLLDRSQFPSLNSQVIAHIHVTRFGESTESEWHQAISQIVDQSDLAGVILDLRNNPGGLMDQAVPIVSEFVSSGLVLKQEDQYKNIHDYPVSRKGLFYDTPLVILVNSGSASASEIVAGALREHNRALLIGETTFGKGTIQDAQELPGGSGLHLTTGRWLLPSGDNLNGDGLKPDIEVAIDPNMSSEENVDPQLQKAVDELLK